MGKHTDVHRHVCYHYLKLNQTTLAVNVIWLSALTGVFMCDLSSLMENI